MQDGLQTVGAEWHHADTVMLVTQLLDLLDARRLVWHLGLASPFVEGQRARGRCGR